jgi:hypothetical protein
MSKTDPYGTGRAWQVTGSATIIWTRTRKSLPHAVPEMASAETPSYPATEIEGLITALAGVLAARVSLSDVGAVEEIHVLADEQRHPKQIVRNIESALGAGLALAVDRRVISVAQVRGGEADLSMDDVTEIPVETSTETVRESGLVSRYVFVGHDARTQPDLESACRVTIRHGDEVISGSATGPSTTLGRAQAAARAVFAALSAARNDNALGLEGVTLVESHGKSHVLVAAHAIQGRDSHALTGVAALHRSPEEAAILASLQATNRWAEFDG